MKVQLFYRAVVTKEVPAYTRLGNPAKYIKERNRNIDYLNNHGYLVRIVKKILFNEVL